MPRFLKNLISFFLLGLTSTSYAQNRVQAVFNSRNFLLNGEKPFIETYLMVRGNSVKFEKNKAGKYQGSVEIILSIGKNGKSSFNDRYTLLSPETDDSTGRSFNFIDQQRIALDTGRYLVELSIRDLKAGSEPVTATDSILIPLQKGISFSGIQLVESYTKPEVPGRLTKGGYDLIPHLVDYYGQNENKLIVYAELYNTSKKLEKDQRFMVRYRIDDTANKSTVENYSGFKKFNSADVTVFMHEFNIERLNSGNYQLILEAVNQSNEVLATVSQFFTRSNPGLTLTMEELGQANIGGTFAENISSKDSLAEFINSLHPISSNQEKIFARNIVSVADQKMMQQFLYSFWKSRNSANPEVSWEKYRIEVQKVNKTFGTAIRKGYDTDRGRVYLQYGTPDNRTVSQHEPSAYPYEIWQYYKLGRQSNRRFVFYNPDLVTNDYVLIHSDALGEIMNDQWQFMLMKRDSQTNDIDATTPNQHFGTQIQQNYQAPR